MSDVLVSLPDPLHTFVQEQVEKRGYSGPDEYLRALVDEAWTREEREHIEVKLVEGLNSPLREVTPDDWERLRRRVIAGDNGKGA